MDKTSDRYTPRETVSILVVSDIEEDEGKLRRMLRHPNWVVLESRGCAGARRLLSSGPVQLVVCEPGLPDGTWRTLLSYCQALRNPPLVIVVSQHADEPMWSEVLGMGGYDVLVKPYEPEEVYRVLGLAWLNWKAWSRPEPASSPGLGPSLHAEFR